MRFRTPLALLALPTLAVALTACGSSPAENAANSVPTTSKTQLASLVISHATVGCHNWSLNGGPMKVSQTVSLTPGSALTVTDQDVMAHTVVQTAGPNARDSESADQQDPSCDADLHPTWHLQVRHQSGRGLHRGRLHHG